MTVNELKNLNTTNTEPVELFEGNSAFMIDPYTNEFVGLYVNDDGSYEELCRHKELENVIEDIIDWINES
jgi:hypothetical protein